jgi:hypothetical protein
MRLTSLAPPLVILAANDKEMTREEVNEEMSRRFGIEERASAEQVKELSDRGLLVQGQRGHERTWAIKESPNPPVAKTASPDTHPQEICNVPELAVVG